MERDEAELAAQLLDQHRSAGYAEAMLEMQEEEIDDRGDRIVAAAQDLSGGAGIFRDGDQVLYQEDWYAKQQGLTEEEQ